MNLTKKPWQQIPEKSKFRRCVVPAGSKFKVEDENEKDNNLDSTGEETFLESYDGITKGKEPFQVA